jgi:hypothetical protein
MTQSASQWAVGLRCEKCFTHFEISITVLGHKVYRKFPGSPAPVTRIKTIPSFCLTFLAPSKSRNSTFGILIDYRLDN